MLADVFGLKNIKNNYMSLIKKIKKNIIPKIGSNNDQDRVQWVIDILSKIPNNSKILDAGAGECRFKKYCSHLKYTSQDFGEYNGTGDNKGLQTKTWDNSKLDVVSDITKIPVQDTSFDAILCSEVFEHIPNPIMAIQEFSRILKPKGTLIITAPFCSLTHFAPYHFYSGFNIYFYKKHLENAGFKIDEIKPNGNFFSYLAQEIRRLPNIVKDNTSKQKINLFQKIILYLCILTLSSMEKKDINSNEVICFGYKILATKINNI
jgi:ubiquinone/menaquinone biosynthesis C-methylase UbiE